MFRALPNSGLLFLCGTEIDAFKGKVACYPSGQKLVWKQYSDFALNLWKYWRQCIVASSKPRYFEEAAEGKGNSKLWLLHEMKKGNGSLPQVQPLSKIVKNSCFSPLSNCLSCHKCFWFLGAGRQVSFLGISVLRHQFCFENLSCANHWLLQYGCLKEKKHWGLTVIVMKSIRVLINYVDSGWKEDHSEMKYFAVASMLPVKRWRANWLPIRCHPLHRFGFLSWRSQTDVFLRHLVVKSWLWLHSTSREKLWKMVILLQTIHLLEILIFKWNFIFRRFRNAFSNFLPLLAALFQFCANSFKEKTFLFEIYFGVVYLVFYFTAVWILLSQTDFLIIIPDLSISLTCYPTQVTDSKCRFFCIIC